MRLSVVDVQARELAKELVNYKTRVQSHLTDVQKAEGDEERLTKQIDALSDELESVRKQKELRFEGLRLERANEEKVREQLNLTNYTKAGLEAEVEKVRRKGQHQPSPIMFLLLLKSMTHDLMFCVLRSEVNDVKRTVIAYPIQRLICINNSRKALLFVKLLWSNTR